MYDNLYSCSIEQKNLTYISRIPKEVLSPTEHAAREWLIDYQKKYSAVPTLARVRDEKKYDAFVNDTFIHDPLEDTYNRTLDFLKSRYALAEFQKLESIAGEGNPFPVDKLTELGIFLSRLTPDLGTSLLDSDHFDRFAGVAVSHGFDLGLEYIDDATGGLQAGDFSILAARMGTGKTVIACNSAVRWARAGKRVGFVSCEMLPSQVMNRIDGFLGHFNPKLFRMRGAGPSLSSVLPRVKIELEIIQKNGGDILFPPKNSLSIDGVKSFVREHKPDVLIVDALYLLKGNTNDKTPQWEKVKQISNELKDLAITCSIPVFGTSQLNRNGANQQQVELDELAFSDALAMDADSVLGMVVDKIKKNEMNVQLLKNRYGEGGGVSSFRIDWNTMDVSEIPYVAPEPIKLGSAKVGVI